MPTEVEGPKEGATEIEGGRGGYKLVEGSTQVEGPEEGDTETEGGTEGDRAETEAGPRTLTSVIGHQDFHHRSPTRDVALPLPPANFEPLTW